MAICRYFQQGTCRYGDRCKFEHIQPSQQQQQQRQQYIKPQTLNSVGFSFTKALQQNQPSNEGSNFFKKNVTFDQSQNRVHYFTQQQQPQQQQPQTGGFSFTKTLASVQNPSSQAGFFQQQQQPQQFNQFNNNNYQQQHFLEQQQQYRQQQQQLQQQQMQQQQFGHIQLGQNQSQGGLFNQGPSDNSFFTGRSVFGVAGGGGGGIGAGVVGGGGEKKDVRIEEGKSMEQSASVTFGQSVSGKEGSIYSELSSLSQQEVECFQADSFCFARIPVKSPPMQFCT